MLHLPRDQRRCDDCGAPAADEEHVMLRCRGFATDDRRSEWEDKLDFTRSFAALVHEPAWDVGGDFQLHLLHVGPHQFGS